MFDEYFIAAVDYSANHQHFFLKTKGTLFDAPLEDDDVLDEGAVL